MAEMNGSCFCGNVTWSSPGPVLWAVHCHCESCRRSSSAAFVSFFGVPRKSVVRQGEYSIYESSPGVERGHCPKCGSQVFCEIDKWPDEMHLFAATLDRQADFKPTAHVHWDEKLEWLEIKDNLPKYPGSADNNQPIVN